MISSRKLDDLCPIVYKLAIAHIEACKEEGIDLLIYCTYRDYEAQNAEYAKGRTAPGAKVTNARGGESYHNFHCAYDAVPLVNGKAQWANNELLQKVGILGEKVGLEWAGRWTGKLKETVHFQYTGGLSLRELQAGKVPQ